MKKFIPGGILLLISSALLLPWMAVSAEASADALPAVFVSSLDYDAPDSSNNSTSCREDYLCNNSTGNSISLSSRETLVSTSQNLSLGSGYYSSHPIAMSIGSGSSTVISNGDSATSMSHAVSSAQGISGESEYRVGSSLSRNDFGVTGSTTTHMQIDESVTSGRVNMGVLVGDGSDGGRGRGAGSGGGGFLNSAWRDPAIEIEEEYVGTYNISQNFTLSRSYSTQRTVDEYMKCCPGHYLLNLSPSNPIDSDDIFNCSH